MGLPISVCIGSFGGTGGEPILGTGRQLALTCLSPLHPSHSCLVCLLPKPFPQSWCKGKRSAQALLEERQIPNQQV